jgi:hypothetical protein
LLGAGRDGDDAHTEQSQDWQEPSESFAHGYPP